MHVSTRLPLLLLAVTYLLGCATPMPASPFTIEEERVVYKKVGETELALHTFRPMHAKPGERRPAIVFFFGGGWKSGSPAQFYPYCEHLAAQGMVAFSAEYRVESRDGTKPAACVEDGKSAVRWIREHAEELGIDPLRLAAGGGSAGGHVAAATGTTTAFNAETDNLEISCIPDALVLFNPVFDNSPEGYGHERLGDGWREISPLHNLKASTPPTIVFLGTEDQLIPVATAETYRDQMRSLGVRCDLHLYEGQGHGFFNKSRSPESHLDTLEKMDGFLESLDFL